MAFLRIFNPKIIAKNRGSSTFGTQNLNKLT